MKWRLDNEQADFIHIDQSLQRPMISSANPPSRFLLSMPKNVLPSLICDFQCYGIQVGTKAPCWLKGPDDMVTY